MVKKILFVFLFMFSMNIFAQSFNFDIQSFKDFNLNINSQNIYINKIKLENSYNLIETNNTKMKLTLFEIDQAPAWLLNAIIGFGVGSYLQGDVVGGIIGTAGELGGAGLFIGGALLASQAKYDINTNEYSGEYYSGLAVCITGSVLILGTRIFENIRPWLF